MNTSSVLATSNLMAMVSRRCWPVCSGFIGVTHAAAPPPERRAAYSHANSKTSDIVLLVLLWLQLALGSGHRAACRHNIWTAA
jgi:hypothetical protein